MHIANNVIWALICFRSSLAEEMCMIRGVPGSCWLSSSFHVLFPLFRQSGARGRCTSPWAAWERGRLCQSMTRRRIATTKRYMKREVDAVACTAVWAALWAGAVGGAAVAGTGNVNAAAHGKEVSPHAQTAARTTCPHGPPRSLS